ncbi:MAG: AbrB/MazE/SpoVT family DNA-binding domain-containing protein [Chloroflexi bacterium]|nr:AbrB/MazE/SpoVT family DNA-binding domain-containing protein [Chloroflexota bacterium]
MASRVGPKGQVVIAKEFRDRLGVQPGWLALQRLIDDHVEVYFVPPEHTRSLKGSLAGYLKASAVTDDAWERARDVAWRAAAEEDAERATRDS